MSADSEKALAKYVEKMYEIQFSQKENILTPTQLKEIALEMGVTDQEWEESQQVFKGHLENGKELILQQNWTDAIQSLDHAVSLNPYSIDALYYKAQAHVERFEEQQGLADENTARELIERALRVKSGHKPSLKLLSKLRQEKADAAKSTKSKLLLLAGIIGGLVLLASVIGMSIRNAAITQEEGVNQAWAQVENVYQRRADLIPKLVTTVKSASNFEKSMLDKISEIHQENPYKGNGTPSEEELAMFQHYQERLSAILDELFIMTEEHPELSAKQAFSDLQVQIEGSENRISVERRKYNMAVQTYNTYIRQFPQNLLGFDQKAYFKADKKAMNNPDVDL